MHLNGSSTL
jgi:hypothetical protein